MQVSNKATDYDSDSTINTTISREQSISSTSIVYSPRRKSLIHSGKPHCTNIFRGLQRKPLLHTSPFLKCYLTTIRKLLKNLINERL
jgi:hypothetical protein